jgi:electron transfer flavoprotein alpha subunit
LGVRGAFNHTVAIQRAGIIFALNNDPNADIFKQCDYGIVGDWQEVVTAMLRVIREKS